MKTSDIRKTVEEYLQQEEAYGDDAQLKVNPSTGSVTIADGDDDDPASDYWPMMDLVAMSETEPGKWLPDDAAIAEVAAEYGN